MIDPVQMFESAHNNIFTVLQFVKDAKAAGFEMYLTGSRYFRLAREDSDWDFFCQENTKVIDYLNLTGFKPVEKCDNYLDAVTRDVWIGTIGSVAIHIQLVNDVTLKQLAQEAIEQTDVLRILKLLVGERDYLTVRRLIWNLALEAVRRGQ